MEAIPVSPDLELHRLAEHACYRASSMLSGQSSGGHLASQAFMISTHSTQLVEMILFRKGPLDNVRLQRISHNFQSIKIQYNSSGSLHKNEEVIVCTHKETQHRRDHCSPRGGHGPPCIIGGRA